MNGVVNKLESMDFKRVHLPKSRYEFIYQFNASSKREYRVFFNVEHLIKVAIIVPGWRNPAKRIPLKEFSDEKLMFDHLKELLCGEVMNL